MQPEVTHPAIPAQPEIRIVVVDPAVEVSLSSNSKHEQLRPSDMKLNDVFEQARRKFFSK